MHLGDARTRAKLVVLASLSPGRAMGMKMKLYLLFDDRLGIVADISTLVAAARASITSMEVERKHELAALYLELENGRPEFSQEKLLWW